MGACSLREQLAKTTLRNVRLQGHKYVELREDGKRFIFFCTLCLAPCYSDSVLFDHLKGSLHSDRYAAAKATLLKPNPWPYNDGVLLFHDPSDEDNDDKNVLVLNANRVRLLDPERDDENDLAIVCVGEKFKPVSNGQVPRDGLCSKRYSDSIVETNCDRTCYDADLNGDVEGYQLVVPGVLHKDEVSDLEVTFTGVGKIAARLSEKDGVSKWITRIWCEWLGKKESSNVDDLMIPQHDFAVVTFTYNYDLGRKGLLDDAKYLLLCSPPPEAEGSRKKRRKSFSDPEDMSESLSNQYDSSGEESLSSDNSNSMLLLNGCDDELMHSRVISSKTLRRELRQQQRVAAERMCDICQHKMLPGKDVAALLNRKTGKLVCNSRNVNGAFHVFHISCLIHWILLCEVESYSKQLTGPKEKRRSRRKSGNKINEMGKEGKLEAARKQIYSVFCPACQGTGVNIFEEDLEKPTVPLSEEIDSESFFKKRSLSFQMFKYKIKASDARRAWMRSPEELSNCSIGLDFPSQSDGTFQEKVSPLKLLHFYQADECSLRRTSSESCK
ncbi:hypothetical protein RJ640_000265 [Escallonia rubra]|uniref:C2H2-type domain-containing protein n=1 Tax=Escallonia rubra TaxID=112253 RepID=A0AA88QC71_9ASTE|nr:hypothetical protein RJ640_000265 [Escallonia rubra]